MAGYFKHRHRQNNNKIAVFLGFSVFLLLFFSAGVYLLLNSGNLFNQENETEPAIIVKHAAPNYRLVNVLVPLDDITTGQELRVDMFKTVEKAEVGMSKDTISDFEQIDGLFARTLLIKGETFTKSHLHENPLKSAISPKIPAGYRAITINVDDTTSVEGWVLPNSLVDVLWTTMIRGEEAIVVVVENAKVLSYGGSIEDNVRQPDQPIPHTVTLLVTSKDARKIILAQKTGTLALALRGEDETGASEGGGAISRREIYGGGNEQPIAPNIRGTVSMNGQKYIIKAGGQMELVE